VHDGSWGISLKTILLLEDECSLMNLLRHVLKRNGYVIREAASAEDAIRRCREVRCEIDLILADVTLPVSSGIQIALLLRAEVPDLPVILMSGYPVTAWRARDAADLKRLGSDSVIVLQKPFEPQTLLNSIRSLSGALYAVGRAG